MPTNQHISALEGVWLIDGMPFDELGLLVIMRNGRTVQFPTSIKRPRLNQTMRLWHSDFDGETIRFKGSPEGLGWIRGVEFSSRGWFMIANPNGQSSRFHCYPADLFSLPTWYNEMLEKNLEKMAEIELHTTQAEQGVAPNL